MQNVICAKPRRDTCAVVSLHCLAHCIAPAASSKPLQRAPALKFLSCIVALFLGWLPAAQAEQSVYTIDQYSRLVACPARFEAACPAKREVECPPQTATTAVLLVIGQSNAANGGERRVKTRFPDRVLNYFDGHCFVAGSPLLGSGGTEGEFITLLADNLIANGTYKSVMIIATAISGSQISRWQKGGDLNQLMLSTVIGFKSQYKITDIVWHQGEGDYLLGTTAQAYTASFQSMRKTLTDIGVAAPIFISISTFCGTEKPWQRDNPIAQAQGQLADPKAKILLGAHTDQLLVSADRRKNDQCHFSDSGQRKTASAYAIAIKDFHASRP